MTLEKTINLACAARKRSKRWLAGQVGLSPQNFHAKMKRESFTDAEMEKMANALGLVWQPSQKGHIVGIEELIKE